MSELKNIVSDTVFIIDQVSDLFYKQQDREGYARLNGLIENISETMGIFLSINQTDIQEESMEIVKYLNEALSAMEAKDTILLADILQYEIKERFQKLYEMI